uniref:Ribosomal RNA adenine dimethylase domain containing 1 n=1 Tax=Cyprinus carpio TaxID=7962 RepID=A0A8C2A7V1_CYPCA
GEEMFVASFSEQEQRELAEKLTSLLSAYRHVSDSYIIEFFSESLWDTLPVSWQDALGDLTPPQIADLLLDKEIKDRRLHSAPGPSPRHVVGWVNPKASWDVFIQQLGVTATESDSIGATTGPYEKKQQVEELNLEPHSCQIKAEELQNTLQTQKTDINTSDSVAQINTGVFPSGMANEMLTCKTVPVTNCGAKKPARFVLTGLHACGDLSSTLLRHFANCPHVHVITSVACCYMKISTQENPNPLEFGYPMSDWVRGLPGHQLSYKGREGACHAIEDYLHRLREESGLLRTHCYRAILESIIRAERHDMRRPGVQTVRKAHFQIDPVAVAAMLAQQGKVVAYFSLVLLLTPVMETLVLLDRMVFLQERGFQSTLIPLFDAAFFPRNLVLVAVNYSNPSSDSQPHN